VVVVSVDTGEKLPHKYGFTLVVARVIFRNDDIVEAPGLDKTSVIT
jgi:hypothetical protein